MQHRTRVKRLPAIAMFGLLAVLAGCGSSSTSLAAFQPEINNAPDNFQLQATAVSNVSTTLSYSWSNTGTRATVNHSSVVSGGSTLLVMKDASGTTVYSKALSSSLNEPTTAGMAGVWTIQLTLTNVSGTLNFRAQKL